MSRRWSIMAMIAGLLILLIAVNGTIRQRENLLQDGTRILLPLAPIDPRSLMQGDYMALRFQLAIDIDKALASAARAGKAVALQHPEGNENRD